LKAEQLSIVVCGEVHLQTYLLWTFRSRPAIFHKVLRRTKKDRGLNSHGDKVLLMVNEL